MSLELAWLFPLAWGLAALAAVMLLKPPHTPRPQHPEPTHTATPTSLRSAA